MITLVNKLVLSLAFIDFILTLLWIYRWQSSKNLKNFKRKLPIKLIEANPVIRHTIDKFGLYPGVVLGYSVVLLIQLGLAKLHIVMAWVVCIVLALAILLHIKNNLTTTSKHIGKLTKEYNLKLKEQEVKNE